MKPPALPAPLLASLCGLIFHKLNHAIITGNRLVGTRQALLDLGENGEQVLIRDNATEVKPAPAKAIP